MCSLLAFVAIYALTSCAMCGMMCADRRDTNVGRLPTGQRKYQIQTMFNLHHEIKRMLLLGMKHVDIARELGVSEVTVSYTANSSIVKRELDLMNAARDMETVNLSQRIQEIAPKALKRMEELLESKTEKILLATAKDLLDRAGYGAVQKVAGIHAMLSKDDLEEMKRRARQSGLSAPDPVADTVAAL
jgi:hypothetical protein